MEVSGIDDYKAPTKALLQLQGNKSRKKALRELIKALPRQQLRDLLLIATEVDFHCDLIARLPFEINQMIFQQLPLRQVFQARRVSRAWRDALIVPELVYSLLRLWYPSSNDPAYYLDGLSPELVASLNAEHVDAYRNGKAFSIRTHCTPSFQEGLEPDCIAYADGLLAWVDPSDSVCKKLDVRTGDTVSSVAEDRSHIHKLALSSSMLAVTTVSGKCYLWMLKEQKSMSIRLPSPWVSRIFLTNHIVVIVYQPESAKHNEVLKWTLSNQKTQSFAFDRHASVERNLVRDVNVMLDKAARSILYFERNCADDSEEIECVYFTRTSLDGETRAQGMVAVPHGLDSRHWLRNNKPVEVNQYATLWANLEYTTASTKTVRICYDFDRNCVVYETDVITGVYQPEKVPEMFFHKEVAYYPLYQPSGMMLGLINFNESTCSKAPMSAWPDHWPDQAPNMAGVSEDDRWAHLFGDEHLLVYTFNGGIVVWNFDRDCKMTKENIPHRTARQEKGYTLSL